MCATVAKISKNYGGGEMDYGAEFRQIYGGEKIGWLAVKLPIHFG